MLRPQVAMPGFGQKRPPPDDSFVATLHNPVDKLKAHSPIVFKHIVDSELVFDNDANETRSE